MRGSPSRQAFRDPAAQPFFASPQLRPVLLAMALLFTGFASDVVAETISGARYEAPVSRYGHFALGHPHEYARLTAATDSGRTMELSLPEDEVFEDLVPRLVSLAAGESAELLSIVSRRRDGARLVMIRLAGDRLEISAESPAIGTPMRWLNPVGVVDLDGDGRAEIAVVTTPHIGGTLRVYRMSGRKLVEVAALAGFSNHVLGSTELGLSTPVSIGGQMRLLVPDATRRNLRIIALVSDRLVEVGRCALPAAVTGAIKVVSSSEVSAGLTTGRHTLGLTDCPVN